MKSSIYVKIIPNLFFLHKWNLLFTIIVYIFCTNYVNAQVFTDSGKLKVFSDSIVTAYEQDEYEIGVKYAYKLHSLGGLSEDDMYNASSCFLAMHKYQEFIKFITQWEKEQPNKIYNILSALKGECYFWLEDYEKSEFQFAIYILNNNTSKEDIKLLYVAEYATSLYKNHKYKEADNYFSWYFKDIALYEKCEVVDLPNTSLCKFYGYFFYYYAYNCFMQGQENKGAALLEISKRCGNEYASKDIQKLNRNLSFANNYTYNASTISEFEKWIKALDCRCYSGEAYEFWKNVQSNNLEYKKFVNASKTSASYISAYKKEEAINDVVMKNIYRTSANSEVRELELFLERNIGGGDMFLKEIRIIPAKEENACALPFGNIFITSALAECYNWNRDLLLAVCGHEATHYILQHQFVELWKKEKKEKRNQVWGEIAAGLNTAANAAVAFYGASNGVSYEQDYWDDVNKINNGLMYGFKKDAYYYKFKYERRQELESDIVAYRFCEAIGIGGYAYIMALQLLDGEGMYMKVEKTADHPSNAFRIGLLKHLWNKEHLDFAVSNKNFRFPDDIISK